jgi:hypothetical protein
MIEVVIALGTLSILLLFVAQLRRLVSHAILNRTIREALRHDPASARLLIAKLEPRPRWPDGLAGWILVVAGVAIGIAGFLAPSDDRTDIMQIAIAAIVIGAGVLVYSWWVDRATRDLGPDLRPDPKPEG